MSQKNCVPETVANEFQTNELRVRPAVMAKRLWDRHLSSAERNRLVGDFQRAFSRNGTIGMWRTLHNVSPARAIADLARLLGLLRHDDHQWLLREAGEAIDVEDEIANAIAAGHLVCIESRQEAYWRGELIGVDWPRSPKRWEFFSELVSKAKLGKPIDRFAFGEEAHKDIVTKRKSLLTGTNGFPVDLTDLIKVVGRGTQMLNLAADEIYIFKLSPSDELIAWRPGSQRQRIR